MNHHAARLLAAQRIADLKRARPRAALSQHDSISPWLVRRRFPQTSRAIRQDPAGRCATRPPGRDPLPTTIATPKRGVRDLSFSSMKGV